MAVWGMMNLVWFALPLVQYGFLDAWCRQSFWHRCGLASRSQRASYPLSWHLSLVAIPSSGATFLPPLLGISRNELFFAHKLVARCTIFWAVLHVSGQLAYLIATSSLSANFSTAKGENLLFIFGACAIVLLLCLAAVAIFRHHRIIAPHFRALHRTAAALALLSAAAHWWPFALLLCPAMAVAATSAAIAAKRRWCESRVLEVANEVRASAAALAAALVASVAGLASVWDVRERVHVMGRAGADTYTAFAFPPLAVVGSALAARAAAALVLGAWKVHPKERAILLLPEG